MGVREFVPTLAEGGSVHHECRDCGRNLDPGAEACPDCGGEVSRFAW